MLVGEDFGGRRDWNIRLAERAMARKAVIAEERSTCFVCQFLVRRLRDLVRMKTLTPAPAMPASLGTWAGITVQFADSNMADVGRRSLVSG